MTSKAMKESDINGDERVDPNSFAAMSIAEYFSAT
jgi:hypothetical protein